MRKNLFINLSNKDLQDCFHSYRAQFKKDFKKKGIFAQYVNEYVRMLESEMDPYRYYDDNKKYNIAFSIAEKDMLYDMARRYLKLYDIFANELKPFFNEEENLDYINRRF